MDVKGKGVRIQQKVQVGEILMDALPYNTIDEVFVDVDNNIMLKDKLININSKMDILKEERRTITENISTVEETISNIQSNIGGSGNISQEISTARTDLENTTNKLTTVYDLALEAEDKLNTLKTNLQTHKDTKITNIAGVHCLRYVNDTLSYRDNDMNWHEIKMGGDILELIKQAMGGKISKNQFIQRRVNCTVNGGCYKNGKYFINTPIIDESPTSDYKVMTIQINADNSDPFNSVSYLDDAQGIVPGSELWDDFFGHYPCLFKDGREVGRLQRNDFTKFLDGSPADITSGDAGDVMIAFPRLGLKLSTEGNILSVSITNNPNDSNFKYYAHSRGSTLKNKFYIGAYKGSVINGKLRSLSGKEPVTDITIDSGRTFAQNNGEGYEQLLFYPLSFLQSLYLFKYKNLNCQNVIGEGYTVQNSSKKITGNTSNRGMDWGESTGKDHMKLLGIEDLWGNCFEWLDGFITNSVGDIYISDNAITRDRAQYTKHGRIEREIEGYVSQVIGNSECCYIAKNVGGTASTYFCDRVRVLNNGIGCFGGSYGSGTNSGIFDVRVVVGNVAQSNVSTRLMYL